jgi:hypothetical protein
MSFWMQIAGFILIAKQFIGLLLEPDSEQHIKQFGMMAVESIRFPRLR